MKRPRASLVSPNDQANRKKNRKKSKSKNKQKNQQFLDSIQVPLNNRFNALSDDEDITDKDTTQKNPKVGLPEIDTAIITDDLTSSHNITPTKVIMFNTKGTTKLYLCHFEKNSVNMKTLSSIKSVYHHIVGWQTYKPKSKGPTQCFKCTMYGHGISSCNRFAVCMLCSGNHLTTTCTVISKDTPNPVYKCFNCDGAKLKNDHKASDINCPFRAKYIATIDKARNNKKQKTVAVQSDDRAQPPHTHSAGAYVRALTSVQPRTFAEVSASPVWPRK